MLQYAAYMDSRVVATLNLGGASGCARSLYGADPSSRLLHMDSDGPVWLQTIF